MNWFTRLLRRKPKPEPEPDVGFDPEHGRDRAPKPAADIIGRQGGQKRNRTHIYRQPLGYPIRLCDWIAVDMTSIEYIGEAQGVNGPAQKEALVVALDWVESRKNAIICKHCRANIKHKSDQPELPMRGEHGTTATSEAEA